MPPNRSISNSYTDDRRQSGPRHDPYKRRDSRDTRDVRQPTEVKDLRSPYENRNPRDYRRDNELPPRPPHIDTSFKGVESSRNMSHNSPASAHDKSSEELRFKRINPTLEKSITTNSATINPPTPIIPKAENPELQEVFEIAYRWGEKCSKRLILGIRKNKVAQERAQRQLETDKFHAKASAYPPYYGLGDKFDARDRDLDDQLKVAEDDYVHELEQLVAQFTTVAKPPATNRQDPVVVALEAKVEQISQLLMKQTEQIQSLDTDNKSLRKQLQGVESNTEKTLRASEARLTESRRAFEAGLEERITGVETKLNDFQDFNETKEKLHKLDLTTFNEICDAWVSTEYNLKTQHNEYRERCLQNESTSTDEALRSLCHSRPEVESLQIRHSQQPGTGTALSIQAVEAIIDAKVMAAEQSIQHKNETFCAGRDDMFGEMIDSVSARVDILEREASKHSELEMRIQPLEQWKAIGSAFINKTQDSNLVERVTRLEGQRVGHRVDRIDLDVGELSRKYEALKSETGQLVKREWVDARLQELLNNFFMNSDIITDIKELQRKTPAIELAIKALDTQFQHLSTKQLAEHIVRLTNPTFEQRLGKMEVKANQLEGKTNGSDIIVNQHTEQLNSITKLLRAFVPNEKRVASPSHSEESSKRRKLELNGRHPSPLQQQQQQQQRDK